MEAKPYLRKIVLKRDAIGNFDEYPYSIPVVRKLDFLEFHPDVTFEETEHFAITKEFLNNHGRILHHLLKKECD
jgi:predicted ATPase